MISRKHLFMMRQAEQNFTKIIIGMIIFNMSDRSIIQRVLFRRKNNLTREDEIFKKLKNGDESGVSELVELYYEDILRYCMFRLPDRYLAEDAAQEEPGVEETEQQEDFRQIIRSLPPELGEIVFLRFSQELKMREIAEMTGVPLRTVQSRLRRALKMLRAEMEAEETGQMGWKTKQRREENIEMTEKAIHKGGRRR